MLITPVVTQANSVLSIRLQATFIGDPTDAQDKALIAAYGDPRISLVGNGTFVGQVPGASPPATFNFIFPCSQYLVGITTQMASKTMRFMTSLPQQPSYNISPPGGNPGYNPDCSAPQQGALDCITPYPAAALEAWWTAMQAEINTALTALRLQSLVPSLPAVDI